MWAWFCSVERSVLGKCLLCLIMYLCVFMKHSLCESNIDLLSLSTLAFYFTDHCRHVKYSKKFKYREKYIGPKGENRTSSCSYSFALFCWSNMMKQGLFFTLYPLEFLESVRWNEKKIKWKQIVHFWINLPSSTPGSSLPWLWWTGVCWFFFEFTFAYGSEKALVIPTTSNIICRL